MRCQLVLQFRSAALNDIDAIAELEDRLTVQLDGVAEVDGHDVGSGEVNIFIFTPDPIGTFSVIQPVLERARLLDSATVAYRPIDGGAYIILWPEHSAEMFRVA
jgi:hypothetical protein